MNNNNTSQGCQINDIQILANGPKEKVPFGKSIRLLIRKKLGPRRVRRIKKYLNDFLNRYARLKHQPTKPPVQPMAPTSNLKARDQVRVKSRDQIIATLDHWGQLKGCSFAPEMAMYCDTAQKVLKPVERFVDERDFIIRNTKKVVLLEGITCQGTSSLGRCDRNCYYFWREEWLDKIQPPDTVNQAVNL